MLHLDIYVYIAYSLITEHVKTIMQAILSAVDGSTSLPSIPMAPPTMTSQLDREDVEAVKARQRSRFSYSV